MVLIVKGHLEARGHHVTSALKSDIKCKSVNQGLEIFQQDHSWQCYFWKNYTDSNKLIEKFQEFVRLIFHLFLLGTLTTCTSN